LEKWWKAAGTVSRRFVTSRTCDVAFDAASVLTDPIPQSARTRGPGARPPPLSVLPAGRAGERAPRRSGPSSVPESGLVPVSRRTLRRARGRRLFHGYRTPGTGRPTIRTDHLSIHPLASITTVRSATPLPQPGGFEGIERGDNRCFGLLDELSQGFQGRAPERG